MTYRVGISGLGRGVGPGHMFAAMPDCQVAAGCDPDPQARERFEEQFPGARAFADYDAMLAEGLDIVFVGTPMPLHRDQTVAALEAGCHVLQEVTLANTVQECRDVLETVKARPRQKFMLAENNCYRADIMAWQEMWAQGLLGEFIYAEAEYVHDIRSLLHKPDGTPTWRAARPPIVYCSHSLGPILKVTGERCTSVCAMQTKSLLEPELEHQGFQVGLFQTTGGGVIKMLRTQAVTREPAFHYFSLYGTKGCLETSRPPVSPLRTNAYLEQVPHLRGMIEIPLTTDVPGAPVAATRGGHGTVEYFMVRDFLECIRRDTPPPIDIYAALDMTLPGLCAYESAVNGGQPVPIPDWRE
jgi:predicted dehydrogenase